MGRIRVLAQEVANQIAAGEVVERPASVVKELVENALDAGAGRVAVSIEGGGADLIEVEDDGCGMDPDDARLACERHATSKVASADDLRAIRSFGFRGEALPSIASVSRLTLTTSTGAPDGGVRVSISAGHLLASEPAAHPRGTTVRVEALFHNAPARRKFLRATATESAHIVELLSRLAAAHPGIGFRLRSHGRDVLHWPAAPSLADRAAQILGAAEAAALRPVDHREGGVRLAGLASPPSLHRGTPRDEMLYVNARPIRDRRLLHAVHHAYATLLPRGRFPLVLLFLDVPVEEVDVNVHPAKNEVRFRRAGAIHDLVARGLGEALGIARPFAALGDRPLAVAEPRAPDAPGAPDPAWGAPARGASDPGAAPGGPGQDGPTPAPASGATGPATAGPALYAESLEPLAQYRSTYILAAAPDGLVIVDQHAAHERVLYERHLAEAAASRVVRQRLLFPLLLEVGVAQAQALEACRDLLEEMGFAIVPFGGSTLRVEELPATVPAHAAERLVRQVLAELLDRDRPRAAADLRHRLAATAACHAAVRANEPLALPTMRAILDDLLRAQGPMTCPHGRPTLIRLPLGRLEREFGRA
jgi:DNA mismatch repair protein MutL